MISYIKNDRLRHAATAVAYLPIMLICVVLGAIAGGWEYGRQTHQDAAAAWRGR